MANFLAVVALLWCAISIQWMLAIMLAATALLTATRKSLLVIYLNHYLWFLSHDVLSLPRPQFLLIITCWIYVSGCPTTGPKYECFWILTELTTSLFFFNQFMTSYVSDTQSVQLILNMHCTPTIQMCQFRHSSLWRLQGSTQYRRLKNT